MDAWQRQVYDKMVDFIKRNPSNQTGISMELNAKEIYIIKLLFEERFMFLKKDKERR